MKEPELFKLLKNFSESDYTGFEKFLLSPYLNRNKSLTALFKAVKIKKDLVVTGDFSKLTRAVKRKTSFSDATIKKLYSFLSDAVLDYYKVKSLLADDIYSDISLNQYLLKNGDFDTLARLQKSLSKKIDNIDKPEINDFNYTYLHKINLMSASVHRMKYQNENNSAYQLKLISEGTSNFIIYSLINLTTDFVNYIGTSVNSGRNTDSKLNVDLAKIFETFRHTIYSTNNDKLIIVFNLYYKTFMCYNSPSDKSAFAEFKNYFETHLKSLDKEIINSIYNCLLNYCSLCERVMDDDKFFYREELELMKIYIENEYYKSDAASDLSPVMYRNYVINCLGIGDTVRLKWFIDNYSCKLKISERVEWTNFALAHYYYGIKDYQKALEHLSEIHLDKFMYKYDLKIIKLKIYFETEDFDSVENVFHNYKELVKNDALLTKYDKLRFSLSFKHFTELLRLFVNPENKDTNSQFEVLINEIENGKSFIMKKWILEKLNNKLDLFKKTELDKNKNVINY